MATGQRRKKVLKQIQKQTAQKCEKERKGAKTVENKRRKTKTCKNDRGTFCWSFFGHFPVAIFAVATWVFPDEAIFNTPNVWWFSCCFCPASPSVTFGVSSFAVFLGYSLCRNEEDFYCLQGRSEGPFQKMTLVFPCFAVYATYEQVSFSHGYRGRFPGNSLVLVKCATEKWHFENDTWT